MGGAASLLLNSGPDRPESGQQAEGTLSVFAKFYYRPLAVPERGHARGQKAPKIQVGLYGRRNPRGMANSTQFDGFCYSDHNISSETGAVSRMQMQGKVHSNIHYKVFTWEYIACCRISQSIRSSTCKSVEIYCTALLVWL